MKHQNRSQITKAKLLHKADNTIIEELTTKAIANQPIHRNVIVLDKTVHTDTNNTKQNHPVSKQKDKTTEKDDNRLTQVNNTGNKKGQVNNTKVLIVGKGRNEMETKRKLYDRRPELHEFRWNDIERCDESDGGNDDFWRAGW